MSRAGLVLRLAILGLFTLVVIGPQALAVRFGWPRAGMVPMLFHRLFLRLFGIRVYESGTPSENEATLVLANHVSWIDIPVIGSLRPLSFIAKSEVGTWPGVGTLARLQRSVFIDRKSRRATAEVSRTVAHRLVRGEVMILFAEGTSGDGNRVLPFRSSLVGAAQAALTEPGIERVLLQPLAITYTRRAGLPVARRERPEICWYGDMDLVPHIARFAKAGALDVAVVWGEPFVFAGNRKEATARAEQAVREAIAAIRQSEAQALSLPEPLPSRARSSTASSGERRSSLASPKRVERAVDAQSGASPD
jgi:1-acyl-sn-glycerol-3-phosphate acyltransferase